MANDYRNESRRRPVPEKYGTPGTQYPTPNPYDVIITEEVTNRVQAFEPVLYGTPHPTVPEAVLCFQGPVKGNNIDKAPVRIYANPRLAQEPYNLVNGDDEANDPDFPVFVRSYLLPRGYTKGVPGTALGALIGLKLNAAGSGYTPNGGSAKLALSFTGGAGDGAAGYAEIVAGEVVAVVPTHTGSGYTSAPAVTLAGGTGASITALLQPATALLVNEVEQPAEEPLGGLYVRVTRTWETLPGKVVVISEKYDPESGAAIITTRQRKLSADVVTGFFLAGSSVITKEKQDVDGISAYEIVETIEQSPYHSEGTAKEKDKRQQYQFPAYLLSYGNYLGVTFTAPDFFGDGVGVRSVKTTNATHTYKTWWVHSFTKPTLFIDEITMNDIMINGRVYECLHDDITRVYGSYVETVPATTPSMSEYFGSAGTLSSGSPPPSPFDSGSGTKWVGTSKTPLGGVENDGHPYRWRVDIISLVMR